ncbi:MAG: tetratricopeptide repeat protein [Treponema sp.]|jgi:tetratricopeptide (TPR) repeat protein|nr:tetratricopeptide repeat protein [Treponema sp.]
MKTIYRACWLILLLVCMVAMAACESEVWKDPVLALKDLWRNATRRFDTSLDHYYIIGETAERETLMHLFKLLNNEESDAMRFAVSREIANIYARAGEYNVLINFLTFNRNRYPNDPYNAYYLLMAAYSHMRREENAVAALCFDMILKNYPDLIVQGESIHLACLNHLITLVDNPEQEVIYYQELISRFSDKIDMGISYFMLGNACERTGDWNGALDAYTNYLSYRSIIPGFPNAVYYAKQLVDFNNSEKDWTFERLDSLVSAVKVALNAGSSSQLQRCQAKVNFFARSWGEEVADDSGMAEFSLSIFMSTRNLIQYANTLDAGSNATEAYLRTTGWERDISTWYLYFRKIYFPPDPEIHGRWEWAGVYYGERF